MKKKNSIVRFNLTYRHWWLMLVAMVLLVVIGWAHELGGYQPLQYWYFDRLVSFVRHFDPTPVKQDVVLVGLDERYMRHRTEPFVMMHEDLGRFMEVMALAKPKAVTIDIALPEKPLRNLTRRDNPGYNYDLALVKGLVAGSKAYPLVLAKVWDPLADRYRDIFQDFAAAARIGEWNHSGVLASAVICPDNDEIVRRYPGRECQPDQGNTPTMSEMVMNKLGLHHQEYNGLIDFTIGPDFQYISLADVLQPSASSEGFVEQFANKIVLMGPILSWEDRHPFPLALMASEPKQTFQPGLLVHAQVLRSLLNKGLVRELPVSGVFLVSIIGMLFLLGSSNFLKILLLVPFVLASSFVSWQLYKHQLFVPVAGAWTVAVMAIILRAGLDFILSDRERKFLKRSFGGVVSPGVMEAILDGRIQPDVSGQRTNAVVLFSDIRGFTTLSESLPPNELISLLNDYLAAMTEVIHKHQGSVISFMGDGIMALFGCPNSLLCPEQNALVSAKDMMACLQQFNEEHPQTPLSIGIGIHAGDVMAGNIGSASRYEFTVIGDVVNTASRLESLTKELGYPIVFSESVEKAVAVEVCADFVSLGMVPIRGRSALHLFGWNPLNHKGGREK